MGSKLREGRRVKSRGAGDRLEIDLRSAKPIKSVLSLLKRKYKREREVKMPVQVEPMMATLVKEPFDDENWEFEIKWDGYRCVAFVGDGKVDLRSRTGLSYNKYTPIVTALRKWNIPAVLDGELVVLNENGTSNFELLQNWNIHSGERLVFIVFDILWLDGINLLEQTAHRTEGNITENPSRI